MTKFSIGDRVRVTSSVYSDPTRTSSGSTIDPGAFGTVSETGGTYTRVAIDGPAPKWAPLFVENEIELAPAPSLAEDPRAKAAAKRAEADEAEAKVETLYQQWQDASDRAFDLRQRANALEVAVKILEETA